MCYIFKSLKANRLLFPGDTIALGTPIFTPYLEMTHLEDYDLKVVTIAAPQENRFQYTDEEIKKLEDPKIKAFFIVNPGNPTGMGMNRETIAKIVNLVKTKRPDLMLLTDDVYGTFVEDFRSLLGEASATTRSASTPTRSISAAPGWRLGVIAIHEDNIFDEMIAKLPAEHVKALDKRYGPITLEPRKLKFIDRIVADSRDIGLNHTAGLSLPQQVMMTMFSLYELMDEKKDYQKACMEIVQSAAWSMIESLGLQLTPESKLRRLLRPDRFRVLGPQEHRRRGGRVPEEEHSPARPRLPIGRGSRHRAAERRGVRGAAVVDAGVPGEPARRSLRGHRTRRSDDRARLSGRLRSVEGGAADMSRGFRPARRWARRPGRSRC